MLKRILLTTLFALLTAAAGTGYFLFAGDYVRNNEESETVKSIDVVIKDSVENNLVRVRDIMGFLNYGEGIIGSCRAELGIDSIEKRLLERGEITDAEVFSDNSGVLRVEILQRKPAIRFSGAGAEFYSDSTGYIFPVYKKADVPIVTGSIPVRYAAGGKGYPDDPKELAWIKGMAKLSSYIEKHYYWHKTVEQIDVENSGDIVLYMRDARQKFIFGSADGIEDKFARMATFYKGIAPLPEAGRYTTVNLKYDKQIICR